MLVIKSRGRAEPAGDGACWDGAKVGAGEDRKKREGKREVEGC